MEERTARAAAVALTAEPTQRLRTRAAARGGQPVPFCAAGRHVLELRCTLAAAGAALAAVLVDGRAIQAAASVGRRAVLKMETTTAATASRDHIAVPAG